jgi:hypothetical protein
MSLRSFGSSERRTNYGGDSLSQCSAAASKTPDSTGRSHSWRPTQKRLNSGICSYLMPRIMHIYYARRKPNKDGPSAFVHNL